MKKWIVAIGTLFLLLGILQFFKYFSNYNILTQYGKGYVWGSGILIIIGIILIIVGTKKKVIEKS